MKFDNILAERSHKVIYRDGDLVAKVFDESFPKSDVLNEALNQARVEETGLNIPKLEEVTKLDGKWAIVSEYIEGKTLKQLMDENPDKLDEYLELFVSIQMDILSKKCPLLKRLKDKMQDKISQTDLDTQGNGAADAARTYLTFCLGGQKALGEKYLNLFCKKTDTARQYVNEWLPIVAASQSVKGKPEERDFLLSWVNVCDWQ